MLGSRPGARGGSGEAAACVAEDAGPLAPPSAPARGRLPPSAMPPAAAPSAPAFQLASRRVSPPGRGSRYPSLPPSVSPRTAQAGAQPWSTPLSVSLTPPDRGPSAQVCRALGLLCGEAPQAALSPLPRAVLPPVTRLSAVQPHPSPVSLSPIADPAMGPWR